MIGKKDIIISVDAGGTSTKYAFIGSDKTIYFTYTGGSGSPAVNENGPNEIIDTLKSIYKDNKENYILKGIVIGLSGYALVDVPSYLKNLEDYFKVPCFLDSDAYLALYTVLSDKYDNGVVVISGTGAVILAKNNDSLFMSSGWGSLLTERGSGYTIVKDYICRMIHHNEEKGSFSELEQSFLNYMNYTKIEDFKMLIYRHHKNEVATYSKFFINEAKNNNQEAIDWLYENGELLGIDTINALKRVDMPKDFVIGFRGGVMELSPYLEKGALDKLNNNNIYPRLSDGETNPIYGGYYIAKKKGFF